MAKEIAAGTVICQDGEMADSIYLIMSGTGRATYAVGEFFLEKGDIIGLCEIYREKYIYRAVSSRSMSGAWGQCICI